MLKKKARNIGVKHKQLTLYVVSGFCYKININGFLCTITNTNDNSEFDSSNITNFMLKQGEQSFIGLPLCFVLHPEEPFHTDVDHLILEKLTIELNKKFECTLPIDTYFPLIKIDINKLESTICKIIYENGNEKYHTIYQSDFVLKPCLMLTRILPIHIFPFMLDILKLLPTYNNIEKSDSIINAISSLELSRDVYDILSDLEGYKFISCIKQLIHNSNRYICTQQIENNEHILTLTRVVSYFEGVISQENSLKKTLIETIQIKDAEIEQKNAEIEHWKKLALETQDSIRLTKKKKLKK